MIREVRMGDERRIAIISGAERGLGRAIARQLAQCSFTVLPTSREMNLCQLVVDEITAAGGEAVGYQLDVTDQQSIDAFVTVLTTKFGRADVLVNNAGILIDTTDVPSEANLEIVKRTLDTNLFGAWRLCSAILPIMKRCNYGRIVNISSKMGQLETMSCTSPAYRVSKVALNALTCMLAAEVEGTDILVNSVEPGWMRTSMGGPEAPLSPEEGAEAAVWLATLKRGQASGSFFFNRRLIPW
jgi:NAD(P)-dependent dehydrogenase (short-subunit alcohol dehydrogenase family)